MPISPRDIVIKLCRHPKGVTALRVQKAQGLAIRSGITWADVLAAMSDQQRADVETALKAAQ